MIWKHGVAKCNSRHGFLNLHLLGTHIYLVVSVGWKKCLVAPQIETNHKIRWVPTNKLKSGTGSYCSDSVRVLVAYEFIYWVMSVKGFGGNWVFFKKNYQFFIQWSISDYKVIEKEIKLTENSINIQGEQWICERSWKYKVICQKVDNPAHFFLHSKIRAI